MSLAILLILELLQSFLTYSNLLQNYAQTYINITFQTLTFKKSKKTTQKAATNKKYNKIKCTMSEEILERPP